MECGWRLEEGQCTLCLKKSTEGSLERFHYIQDIKSQLVLSCTGGIQPFRLHCLRELAGRGIMDPGRAQKPKDHGS
jgi:hypothetical protein